MKHIHLSIPWLTLSLSVLSIITYLFPGPVPDFLIYDQQVINNNQIWKLVSAHFCHSDDEHLMWNISALLILGSLLEIRSRQLLTAALVSGMIGVNLLLILGPDHIQYYAGLSGVLNSLLAILLCQFWIEFKNSPEKRALIMISALLCVAKIIVEILIGSALFTHTSWTPLPQSHLAGFLAGLIYSYWANNKQPVENNIATMQIT